ncbi:hypothetical protein [uncultured Psychrobacter sp.]|uniref:hypothetical protein n=1 Tax=uncultured Psychrobacter sp. TaxID=259303 RepID=UPI002624A1DA|nr:hypothetical protein [uncultured Psychrobacter sp.]
MTQRNSTPRGARYQTPLGKALADRTDTVASVRPAKKPKSIDDWLRADHQRNEYQRDVEQIKRDVQSLSFWLRIGVSLLALVLMMQLIIRFWG